MTRTFEALFSDDEGARLRAGCRFRAIGDLALTRATKRRTLISIRLPASRMVPRTILWANDQVIPWHKKFLCTGRTAVREMQIES
ncbi:MAG: hypothetical protein M5U34_29725 [Chloroflexi bacterium]|nr:hypothetical protein [Chloroflexota bacterium]